MSFLNSVFPKLLYSAKENGNTIEVFDSGNELIFKFNGITYSKINKKAVFTHQYWDYFLPAAFAFEKPRVLLIGLGGGTVVYQLYKLFGKDVKIDVAEISAKMKEVFEKFVPEKVEASVFVGEGSEYVKHKKSTYDVILLDAYVNDKIPDQFLSYDFVNSTYAALSINGLFLTNFAMTFMGALAYEQYVSMLKTRFEVYRISAAITEGNVIILASKSIPKEELIAKIRAKMPKTSDTLPLLANYEKMKKQ
ncbi:MAG: spermidine synthase [Candidatus Micrarchaeia archaeon]